MKSFSIPCVALVAALIAGHAGADTFPAASDMAGLRGVRNVVAADGQTIGVIQNANECAPFESAAVWSGGPVTKLLGYHCYHNPNRR